MPVVIPLLALGAAYLALRSQKTDDTDVPVLDQPQEETPVTGSIDWTPTVERLCGAVPSDFLARWIAKESGGNPCSKGAWGGPWEAGIGQAYYESRGERVFGATLDELRGCCVVDGQVMARQPTTTEMDAHVIQLVTMAQRYIDIANSKLNALGEYWSESDVLCLAKLYHALPVLVTTHMSVAHEDGHTTSWDDYREYMGTLDRDEVAAIDSRAGYAAGSGAARYHPLDRLFANAQFTGRGD